MTLTELRYIVTLAQEQHFGRAAERCHVSQPTLSVGVKKLEDELGVLIFERSKSAVRLTPVGEGIVTQAQKVLEQAQGIRELAQAGKNQLAAPLKIGAIYTVGPYLFPHLIPQLHRVAPDMPLYIEENFTHILRDKLRTGELDAIIIALPFQEADVLTKPLYDEPFYALLPAGHPWAAMDTIDTKLLNDKSDVISGKIDVLGTTAAPPAAARKPAQYDDINEKFKVLNDMHGAIIGKLHVLHGINSAMAGQSGIISRQSGLASAPAKDTNQHKTLDK